MIRLYCALIGYVFGCFQTSFFYGKKKGIDIRNVGSGNAGTTNALRSFGTGAGILVFAGDAAKTMLAIVVVSLLFKGSAPGLVRLLKIYAGFGAILGHNYPFYLSFKGGKGIACTAGTIGTLEWQLVLICLASFFVNTS